MTKILVSRVNEDSSLVQPADYVYSHNEVQTDINKLETELAKDNPRPEINWRPIGQSFTEYRRRNGGQIIVKGIKENVIEI